MSHYETLSKEEKKRRRKRKQKTRKTVNTILEHGVRKDVENYIQRTDGRVRHSDILEFIKDEHINEKWLDDILNAEAVARKVFDKVKSRSKRSARHEGKGVPEDSFIQKKTETWYEVDEARSR